MGDYILPMPPIKGNHRNNHLTKGGPFEAPGAVASASGRQRHRYRRSASSTVVAAEHLLEEPWKGLPDMWAMFKTSPLQRVVWGYVNEAL